MDVVVRFMHAARAGSQPFRSPDVAITIHFFPCGLLLHCTSIFFSSSSSSSALRVCVSSSLLFFLLPTLYRSRCVFAEPTASLLQLFARRRAHLLSHCTFTALILVFQSILQSLPLSPPCPCLRIRASLSSHDIPTCQPRIHQSIQSP